MGTAIERHRQFNPRDLHDDVHDLARVNPAAVANEVIKLARKKNSGDQALDVAQRNTGLFFGTGGAVILTGIMGAIAGSQNAQRDAMLAEWENQGNTTTGGLRCTPWQVGVKDPTIAFWKIPWLAITPVVTAIAWGLTARRRRKHTPKGKKAIIGGGEIFFAMSTVLNGTLALADALSNQSYCKREAEITSGSAQVVLTPTGT